MAVAAKVPGEPGGRGSSPGAHRGRGCWNAGWRGSCAATAGLAVASQAAQPTASRAGWVLENTLFRPQQGSEARPCRTSGRQRHERRHSASALHAAHRQQHFRQPRKQPRLLAVRLPRAVEHAASSSSGQSRWSLPPPSFDQLARDIEAA